MNGVVHVGAHKGEEIPDYIAEGRSPIICFEPLYLDFPHENGNKDVTVVFAALGNVGGYMTLRIPRHLHDPNELDTQSASGLVLIHGRAIANGWTPTECVTQTVPVMRFDNWAEHNGFKRGSCSLLAIDVQGMELQVLQGFGEYLMDFTEIIAECSDLPLYEGGAYASQVARFLHDHGFDQVSPTLRHGDVKFIRSHA